jgi:hypothetical protein
MNRELMRTRVRALLGDSGEVTYSEELINDGINVALDAVLPWIAQRKTITFMGDGALTLFALPEDYYRVISVHDGKGYLSESLMASGAISQSTRQYGNEWVEFPMGSVSLVSPQPVNQILTVHYAGSWIKPVDDSTSFPTPVWLDGGLTYYIASYCLLPKATAAANVRQYNVQVDSGTPIMNPMKDMSSYFLQRFKIEMDLLPAYQKGNR